MTQNVSLKRPQLNNKYGFFKLLSMVSIFLYICSLYILSYSPEYTIICNMLFVASLGFTFIDFVMTRVSFKLDYTFFSLLLFVAYVGLSITWAINDTGVMELYSTLIRLFGLYIIIRMNIHHEKDFRVILMAIYIGALIMCLYTIYYYGLGEIISRISVGTRIGAEINQSNGMGLYCTIFIIMTLYYILYEKKYLYSLFLPIGGLIFAGASSRKAFVLLAVGFLILVMFKSKKGKLMRLLVVLLIILTAVYIVMELSESNEFFYRISQMFKIFGEDRVELTDNSLATRSDMIKYGLELFSDNPVFGYGPEQYEHFYSLVYGIRRPPHSTFIQILVGFGIIGFTLFYGIYVYVVTKLVPMIKKQRKYSILILTFIMVFLSNDIGANMLNNKFLYIFVGIYAAYLTMELPVEKGEDENEDTDTGAEVSYQPDPNMRGIEG